jgi:hypothetical protein
MCNPFNDDTKKILPGDNPMSPHFKKVYSLKNA